MAEVYIISQALYKINLRFNTVINYQTQNTYKSTSQKNKNKSKKQYKYNLIFGRSVQN